MGNTTATAYPPESVYEKWKAEAEASDMTVSNYIQAMTEAGRKKFDRTHVEPDQTRSELREQRNDLRKELENARRRIDRLESLLHNTERDTIISFVEDNEGATYDEITEHTIQKAPPRIADLLTALTGNELTKIDDRYYPADES